MTADFANYLQCNECGIVPECKNCSIKLTYHKHINTLRCHYCGYSATAYKRCPDCGNDSFRIVGYGTQKIRGGTCRILDISWSEGRLLIELT